MCEPRRLTILWASMAGYRDSFTFSNVILLLTLLRAQLEIISLCISLNIRHMKTMLKGSTANLNPFHDKDVLIRYLI
jgi:hypothetical protein